MGATYVDRGLICANKDLLGNGFEGRLNFTFAHEAGHWVLHRNLVNPVSTGGGDRTAIFCRAREAKMPMERQADFFAACLLMPQQFLFAAFEKTFGNKPLVVNFESKISGPCYTEPCVCNWPHIAATVIEAGGFSNVSKQAVIIRLQELGLVINETSMPMNWKSIRSLAATT